MKSLEEGKYLSFPYHVDLPEARKHERLEQLAANAPGPNAQDLGGRDARGELGGTAGPGASDACFQRGAPDLLGLGRRRGHRRFFPLLIEKKDSIDFEVE